MKKFIFTAFAFFMFQVILAQQVNPLQNDKEVIDLQESYNKILKLIFSSNRGNLQRLESVGNAI